MKSAAVAVGRGLYRVWTCPKCGGEIRQGVCLLCGWPEREAGR
jgi:hypothetical protein